MAGFVYVAFVIDVFARMIVGWRVSNCWEIAVAALFFCTLKAEWLDRHRFLTRAEARTAAFDFITGSSNRQRRHSPLG